MIEIIGTCLMVVMLVVADIVATLDVALADAPIISRILAILYVNVIMGILLCVGVGTLKMDLVELRRDLK